MVLFLEHLKQSLLLGSVVSGFDEKNKTKKLVFVVHHILMDGVSNLLHMDTILQCYAEGGVAVVDTRVNKQADTVNTMYQKWDKTHGDSEAALSFWAQQLKSVEALQFSIPETYRKKQGINAFNDETVSLSVNPWLQNSIAKY